MKLSPRHINEPRLNDAMDRSGLLKSRIQRRLLFLGAAAAAVSWSIDNVVTKKLTDVQSFAANVWQLQEEVIFAAWPTVAIDIFDRFDQADLATTDKLPNQGVGNCTPFDLFLIDSTIETVTSLSRTIDLYQPWLASVDLYSQALKKLQKKVGELNDPDIDKLIKGMDGSAVRANADIKKYLADNNDQSMSTRFTALGLVGLNCTVKPLDDIERAALNKRAATMATTRFGLVADVLETRSSVLSLSKSVQSVLATKGQSLSRWLDLLRWVTLGSTIFAAGCAFWRELGETK